MTSDGSVSLAMVRRLPAPAADVFAACTDPRLLQRWLVPGAGAVAEAAVDLRPGGAWRLDGTDPDGGAYAIHGSYLAIEPDRALTLTWTYEGAIAPLRGEMSKVSIALRALGAELTELTLTHTQLSAQEALDIWRTIWGLCLDRLGAALKPDATDEDLRFPGGMLSDLYGDAQRGWQDAFGVRALANRVRMAIVATEIDDDRRDFIQSRDFFFLTTVDHRGYPTCSHKGGDVGVVRVVDADTLAFPVYDGNAMFLSIGNLTANPKVGLLFIDFETPHRVRVHGSASIVRDDPLLGDYPGAVLIVRVKVSELFDNCPRYIHRYQRIQTSKYVPREGYTPPIPQWKHIDGLQDVMPEEVRDAIAAAGAEVITPAEYVEKLKQGDA
jgi:uncharacterized protein YndB with AHSA1/START domain/predicted pyridoxine 5'-phosphate oxidase superfamily flavin-nucleotide-binding protein